MDKSMYIVLFSPKSQKKWMLNNERIDIEFEISGIEEKFKILMISEKLISGIIIQNHQPPSFQKKMDSIFQIKINQEKISSTFQALEFKLHTLQQKISKFQRQKKERGIFDCNQEQGRVIINELILKAIRPLQLTSTQHDHTLRNIQYNHNNLSYNIGQDYKALERKFQESQLQVSRKLTQEEVNNKEKINISKSKIQENYSLFKQFTEEYELRMQQHEEEFKRIWEAVKKVKKQNNIIDTNNTRSAAKKNGGYRYSEIKQPIFEFQNNSNSKLKSRLKKQSLIQGGPFFQSLSREKTTQYASLATKVEVLEKKLKQMPPIPSQQKVVSSRRRISNDVSQVTANNGDQENSQVIFQEKMSNKVQKQSRFRNNSIQVRKDNQQPSNQSREERQSYSFKFRNLQQDIRKINVRLTDFKYKFTLLQENYQIILNKMSKIGQLQISIQAKMDEVEKLRVDLSTINEINMRFRKIQAGFEEHQKKYVDNDEFSKEMSFLKYSIKEIQSQRTHLARNDEIKAAFEFIEKKIKEIVIVLTDKFQNDKEGAINKVQQIKCLTCDKEVEGGGAPFNTNSFSTNFSKHVKTRNIRTTVKRLKTEGG